MAVVHYHDEDETCRSCDIGATTRLNDVLPDALPEDEGGDADRPLWRDEPRPLSKSEFRRWTTVRAAAPGEDELVMTGRPSGTTIETTIKV